MSAYKPPSEEGRKNGAIFVEVFAAEVRISARVQHNAPTESGPNEMIPKGS